MDHENPVKATRYDWILLGILAVSLSVNVVLAVGMARLAKSTPAPNAAGLRRTVPIGTVLPPLHAQRLNAAREIVRYESSDRPILLYVFTPSCQWCARNLANIHAVVTSATDRYRVIGLSLDPAVKDYVDEVGFNFPVYVGPSPEVIEAYGLGSTPHTLVIAPSGKLLKSWIGAFTGSQADDIEAFFGVRLPGLVAEASPSVSQKRSF
jgi:peroxiredoxin